MVFLNWKSLPWFWYGFNHFWFALGMMVLVPAALALVFGWLAFRSRVTGVYLSIITQALSYALMLAFFRNDMGFGGNNGFTDFKDLLGFDLHADRTRVILLVATAAALAASYLACRFTVTSRAGRVIRAIRDAESRTRFLGYRVESYKLWVFVFSAMIAGIAGALYVPQVGIINPSEFAPINSIEVVIWVAIGGRGTLVGAAAGAVLVNYAKTFFTGALPEVWLYALGAMFILVTLFLPAGTHGAGPARERRPNDRHASARAPSRDDSRAQGPDGQLRRLQGAQRAVAGNRKRRAAVHHRPQRRGQDNDDGCDHGEDAARSRLGVFWARSTSSNYRSRKSRKPASAASFRSRRCSSG